MHAVTRIVAFVFVLLSLSFLVSALPAAPRTLGTICVPTGTDAVSVVVAKLAAEIEVKINALLGCGTKSELFVAVDALVALFKGCADELLKVGAGVSLTVEAKASIIASICEMISLLAKVCVQIHAKFGVSAIIGLLAKIDLGLKPVLVNLNVCIGGVLTLIAKSLASTTVGILSQVQLYSSLSVLGLGGLNPGSHYY
ncbi:hypothetical protein FRC07_014480 [Ceratobasidium sp. 392]|nr:hypothetical protein FRC07_014480 [Ceratobasidium sp. 392]